MRAFDKSASACFVPAARARSAAVLLAVLAGALLIGAGTGRAQAPASPSSPTAACPPSTPAPSGSPPSSPTSPTPTSATPAPSTGPYRPAPEEILVCVGTQEVTGATFAHWATIADRSGAGHRKPALEPTRAAMEQALGFLISSVWVLGEAGELGIEVTDEEVARRFDRLRREQFPKHGEFQRFLARTGQTVSDLLLRVKLSMVSGRIQTDVVGHGTARSRQRALSRFVKSFKRRWKARTYCEPQYRVVDCGQTASPL